MESTIDNKIFEALPAAAILEIDAASLKFAARSFERKRGLRD
jgi:hypothetical protein